MTNDLYTVGLGALVGDGGLGVISTPAAQQARLNEVLAQVSALKRDVSTFRPIPELAPAWSTWAAAFADWVAAFEAFKPDWLDRAWGSTADRIESYAGDAAEWRKQFAARFGGVPSYAPGTPAPIVQPSPPSSGPSRLMWFAIGAGAAVGAAFAARALVREVMTK